MEEDFLLQSCGYFIFFCGRRTVKGGEQTSCSVCLAQCCGPVSCEQRGGEVSQVFKLSVMWPAAVPASGAQHRGFTA